MKKLNNVQVAVFLLGALLMVIGAGTSMLAWGSAPYVFSVGALCFASMQMLQRYEGSNFVICRLRRIQLVSDVLFLVSGLLMIANKGNFLGLSYMTYIEYVYNKWVITLLVAAILQLYSTHRLGHYFNISLYFCATKGINMNKILYAFVVMATLASCAQSYSIQGSSSVSSLDGSKLYLKTVKDQELKSMDSCDVVHGKFRFAGLLDTVKLANLYMDDEPLAMPVVVEKGEIEVRIDNTGRSVSGTPLNEKLYQFIHRHDQIGNEMNELSHKQSQMLLDGIDEDVINHTLSAEAARLAQQEDSLVTNFIVENFDNVLGPGVFMMMTSGYPYPVLTPQIEDIMSKATKKFKEDPYVKQYYQTANEIQARQNGLVDDTPQAAAPTQVVPDTQQQVADSMAAPSLNIPQK